jgi:hypothetical protein
MFGGGSQPQGSVSPQSKIQVMDRHSIFLDYSKG